MNHSFPLLLVLVAILATGCTDDPLMPASDPAKTVQQAAVDRAAGAPLAPSLLRSAARRSDAGEFASPLFGLAAAPNGDVLVADAGAGIANRFGGLEIELPGVTDVAPIGRSSLWATVGLTGAPGDDTAQALYRVSNGHARMVVDLYDFEAASDPDGGGVDSNPFDVASLGGDAALVADAAGNTLLRVGNQGDVEVVAIFPPGLVSLVDLKDRVGCAGTPLPSLAFLCGFPDAVPAQAVPTSVAIGPDGYYYVGELQGFPGPTGESGIWRVAPGTTNAICPSSECVQVADGGFTSIIDLAFDHDGVLHVTELDENGWFFVENGLGVGGTINACTLSPFSCSEVATGLPIPTAVTFGHDGTLWATINALIPGAAAVAEAP
ncbi:MAG: ScyD/ScyE family protein [Gemmatimonadota bacterium]